MANPYYDHTTFPTTNSSASSATMRAELDLIEAGFDKLPTLSGNGLKVVRVNAGATALEAVDISGVSQPADATLTSIAALGTGADKMLYTTGVDTWAEASITTAGRDLLDDANAAAQRTTLGVAIGSDVQAYDADTAKLDVIQTWTAAQTFNDTKMLLAGSTSGAMTLKAPAVASTYVATFPAASHTVAGLEVTQTFTVPQRGTQTTDNDLSFDLNATNNFKCTPTAGGALTFTNIPTGQTGSILLVNGSNYAITAAATTKVGTSTLTTISATGTYLLSYYADGTNVYVVNSGALA